MSICAEGWKNVHTALKLAPHAHPKRHARTVLAAAKNALQTLMAAGRDNVYKPTKELIRLKRIAK